MEPTWKQADVFPLIKRIIDAAHQQHQGYISAQEIAARLLRDAEARPLIEQAQQQLGAEHSREWLASNMVAWFGARITVGVGEWGRAVERVAVDGQWAYKPASRAGGCEEVTSFAIKRSR